MNTQDISTFQVLKRFLASADIIFLSCSKKLTRFFLITYEFCSNENQGFQKKCLIQFDHEFKNNQLMKFCTKNSTKIVRDFEKFCKEEAEHLEIYSTVSENETAFAERTK